MSRITLDLDNLGDTPIDQPYLIEAERDGEFVQDRGPFVSYRRFATGESSYRIEAELPKTDLTFLFRPAFSRMLKGRGRLLRRLMPPAPLSPESLSMLGLMFWTTTIIAYCGTLLGQTLAFAAPTLRASAFAQAAALSTTRVDVLLALPLARMADRRIGRARMLRAGVVLAVGATTLASLSPNIYWLTALEILAKAGATTSTLLIAIILTETVEETARAWSLAVLVIATAFGTGAAAIMVAGLGLTPQAWRLMFLIAAVGFVLAARLRRLRDTPRFLSHPRDLPAKALLDRTHRKRLIIVSLAACMINLFYIPQSQLRNQFLRFDRHLSAPEISLFTLGTNLPGGIGLAIGARWSEVRGRKPVAAFGLFAGAIFTGLAFLSSGWLLFTFAALGAAAGTIAVPPMAVYGPELFPTRLRASANALITALSRVGSIVGLFLVGLGASNGLGYGLPIAMLATAPLLLSLFVLLFFPETKGTSLESINPEDL